MTLSRIPTLLTAATALALPLTTRADVITFSNTTHLPWRGLQSGSSCFGYTTDVYLDITQPSTQSGDTQTPTSFFYFDCPCVVTSRCCFPLYYILPTNFGMVQGTAELSGDPDVCNPALHYQSTHMFQPGDTVAPVPPAQSTWATSQCPFGYGGLGGYRIDLTFPCVLGVRFPMNGLTYYGFIALNSLREPIRWGYESTPDTPILIPPYTDCPCDWNLDQTLNSADFFDFLDSYFTGTADFDTSGTTDSADSADFFAFLDCFFEGC